jgi:Mrp family chromosome partitioning ATPase
MQRQCKREMRSAARVHPVVRAHVPGPGARGCSRVNGAHAQLAMALAGMDKQVGLLDIDICGPSQPTMMGVEGGTASVRASPSLQSINVNHKEGGRRRGRGSASASAGETLLLRVGWQLALGRARLTSPRAGGNVP